MEYHINYKDIYRVEIHWLEWPWVGIIDLSVAGDFALFILATGPLVNVPVTGYGNCLTALLWVNVGHLTTRLNTTDSGYKSTPTESSFQDEYVNNFYLIT